jgi:SAM-dependent methyltransferase
MQRGVRRKVKNSLLRSRLPFKRFLARAYLRSVERYRGRRRGPDPEVGADGLPLPPARLRVLVAGTADIERFLRSGELQAVYLRDLLAVAGSPLEQMDAILDFGCGCGRIARWFSDASHPQVHGCDYNRELIGWCAEHLDFMRATATGLEPPLPYPDRTFDFSYAFSVFTHLTVELAERWLAEIERVVKPGGLIWFTVHGESYRERLLPEQLARFDRGEIVVWLPEIEGTNLCSAYWPEAAVARILGSGFEVIEHFDPRADPLGAERMVLAHDAYLARRI